ncbi:LLM class F420-dependent oxidoreductase [soil metagenome]
MSARPLSVDWIMQPAFFTTPVGRAPGEERLAHELVQANERHLELAREAGFDTVWVEDHMASWGDRAHLECFTNLAWLAGRHPELRYGTMVCGVAFRNPAYLAKIAVNLHVLTRGRFVLGVGAGNHAPEHRAYGFPFPPDRERLQRLAEAIAVIRALWSELPATRRGAHYSVEGAFCAPLPAVPIPLMIGGGGERRTLRLVAQHADWWCHDIAPAEVFARKRDVLRAHCEALGRDPSGIVHAQVAWLSIGEGTARRGAGAGPHVLSGDADEVARQLQEYRDAGVDHFQIRFMDHPGEAGLERFAERVLPQLG